MSGGKTMSSERVRIRRAYRRGKRRAVEEGLMVTGAVALAVLVMKAIEGSY